MKKEETLLAERVIKNWYQLEPQAFDSPTNSTWLEIYNRRWLANGKVWDAEGRMKQLPYETFRRVIQEMISDGRLKISEENMKARRRKEVKVREEHKPEEVKPQRINYCRDNNGNLFKVINDVWYPVAL